MLNKTSPVPYWAQIRDHIVEHTLPHIQPGDPLPSETVLAHNYEVTRATVRRAIDELRKRGLVFSIKGKGNFRSKRVFEQSLNEFYSFARDFAERGIALTSVVLEQDLVVLDQYHLEKLGLSSEDNRQGVKIVRLRQAEGETIAFETSIWVFEQMERLLTEDLAQQSLYDIVELKYGLPIERAVEMFEPIMTDSKQSMLLFGKDIRRPALQVERVSFCSDRAVEIRTSIVRGDLYRYRVELKK